MWSSLIDDKINRYSLITHRLLSKRHCPPSLRHPLNKITIEIGSEITVVSNDAFHHLRRALSQTP